MALPPGPRSPALVQSAAWIARPAPFMERCVRRYGDVFTVRLAQVGTFVFTSDPHTLKPVFTAPPRPAARGGGNPRAGAGARQPLGAAARRRRAHPPAPPDAA